MPENDRGFGVAETGGSATPNDLGRPVEGPAPRRPALLSRRFYKVGFIVSVTLNILLVWGFWYYTQVEDTLSMIWSAVEIAN